MLYKNTELNRPYTYKKKLGDLGRWEVGSMPLLLLLALLLEPVAGAVRMPSFFGDGMVLQSNWECGVRSFLSGWASPGNSPHLACAVHAHGHTIQRQLRRPLRRLSAHCISTVQGRP